MIKKKPFEIRFQQVHSCIKWCNRVRLELVQPLKLRRKHNTFDSRKVDFFVEFNPIKRRVAVMAAVKELGDRPPPLPPTHPPTQPTNQKKKKTREKRTEIGFHWTYNYNMITLKGRTQYLETESFTNLRATTKTRRIIQFNRAIPSQTQSNPVKPNETQTKLCKSFLTTVKPMKTLENPSIT